MKLGTLVELFVGLLKDSIQGKDKTMALCRVVRIVSAALILSIQLMNWFSIPVHSLPSIPLWDAHVTKLLCYANAKKIVIGWLIFDFIGESLLWRLFYMLVDHVWEKSTKKYLHACFFAVCDLIEIGVSIYVFLFAINSINEYIHGLGTSANAINFSIFYLVFVLWTKRYNIQRKNQSNTFLSLTNYFDSDGRQIPKDAYVVYNGKLYEVNRNVGLVNALNGKKDAEWFLFPKDYNDNNSIPLDEAVADKQGDLKLYDYSTRSVSLKQ